MDKKKISHIFQFNSYTDHEAALFIATVVFNVFNPTQLRLEQVHVQTHSMYHSFNTISYLSVYFYAC